MTDVPATPIPPGRSLSEIWRENRPMYKSATIYQTTRKYSWVDYVCDTISRAAKTVGQVIDNGNGVSRVIVAVFVVVAAAIIVAAGGLAWSSSVAISGLSQQVNDLSRKVDDGFGDVRRRLDENDRRLDDAQNANRPRG